jgi:hypothetical protein
MDIENQLKNVISIAHDREAIAAYCLNLKRENKTKMIEILNSVLNSLNELYDDDDCDSEESASSESEDNTDQWSDTDSDASFTKEEESYIQNEAHREYLKRYSLKPKFSKHYFNPDRDK